MGAPRSAAFNARGAASVWDLDWLTKIVSGNSQLGTVCQQAELKV